MVEDGEGEREEVKGEKERRVRESSVVERRQMKRERERERERGREGGGGERGGWNWGWKSKELQKGTRTYVGWTSIKHANLQA